MKNVEDIIKNVSEEDQEKMDWTKVWSTRYPILNKYQNEVDIPKYAKEIRKLFDKLQVDYHYSELEAMLVLKDILAHEYLDNKKS